MSAPKGAASISALQLPSPSVVVGDTMRDSNGVVVPLTLLAFDGTNNLIADAPAQFFFTDSTTAARLTVQNLLVGDKIGTVHIIGQIGSLQTPVVNVPVTFLPVAISLVGQPDTAHPTTFADSAASYGFSTVVTRVTSAADSGSQGIIVRYRIVSAPKPRDGATVPTAFFVDDGGKPASTDTTDATGKASRRIAIFPKSIADADVLQGKKVDSAIVEMSASYRGNLLRGSPVTVVVRILAK